jgi:hypothetical protein
VANTATVAETAFVGKDARVYGSARVFGDAWVLGNARSYKKGAVYCLLWNGSSLEEKWRTRETQNYMPDYIFDEGRSELLILQTVQRPGLTDRGASSLAIKKVE